LAGVTTTDREIFTSIGRCCAVVNADLNMTTAMSAIFFVMWFVWAIQANGVGGFLKELFGPKGETTGIVKILMVVIFFAVGWLEVISIIFRPIALSFRLFGTFMPAKAFWKRCPR
jgi:F0F1-type ATP synthase membrane subunit a